MKYLPQYGIQPVVLTTSYLDEVASEVLHQEFAADLPIYRVHSLPVDPFRVLGKLLHLPALANWLQRFFLFPDFYAHLIPAMVWRGWQLIRQGKVKAIFSTSPPESMHLVGWLLHQLSGLPWISDYRDLWTTKQITFRPATAVHRKMAQRLEQKFLNEATAIIANTTRNSQIYQHQFGVEASRIHVITNGFDPADNPNPLPAGNVDSPTLVLGYLGYLDKDGFPVWETLHLLRELREEGIPLRLRVVGYISPAGLQRMEQLGYRDWVEYLPQMPNFRAVPLLQASADMMLVLLYETPYSTAIVPLKTYSYLVMRRRILAVAPEKGELANILQVTRLGRAISLQHPRAIQDEIRRAFREKQRTGRVSATPDEAKLAQYNILTLTRRVANVIRTAVQGTHG